MSAFEVTAGPGVILGQNCVRLSDVAPDDFFFFFEIVLSETG